MGKLRSKIIFIFFVTGYAVFGQDNYRHVASIQVQEMIEVYNNREIPEYVDFLLPAYYGNDQKAKNDLTQMWKKILKDDTDKFELEELLKLTKSAGQVQALFEINFRRKSYIIGISEDNGKTWKFTQPHNKNVQFKQLLELIPSLDPSFAELIDPKFEKRIRYTIGAIIPPFNYLDIYGNEISSKSLKGKIIVLNFWGTWCAPCVKEIPELNELVEKYKDEKVKFIAPAIATTKEILRNNFLPKHPFLYDIVVIDGDDYEITSFPTHIIIDQNNKVIDIIEGYSKANTKKIENSIGEAL